MTNPCSRPDGTGACAATPTGGNLRSDVSLRLLSPLLAPLWVEPFLSALAGELLGGGEGHWPLAAALPSGVIPSSKSALLARVPGGPFLSDAGAIGSGSISARRATSGRLTRSASGRLGSAPRGHSPSRCSASLRPGWPLTPSSTKGQGRLARIESRGQSKDGVAFPRAWAANLMGSSPSQQMSVGRFHTARRRSR